MEQKTTRPALMVATFFENTKEVMDLLAQGVDVNAVDENGWTALATAAARGNAKLVWLLLTHKSDPNIVDDDGCAAFHRAVMNGNHDIIQLMLNAGVNSPDSNGESPLHLAAERDSKATLITLLNNGADLEAKDPDGCTPLMFSVAAGKISFAMCLLQKGADPCVLDNDRETLLHVAADFMQEEMAAILVERYNFPVNVRSKNHRTPLHLAASRGDASLCQYFLEHGAEVNAQIKNGRTPLIYAAAKGHEEVVKILLANGADASIRDKKGKGRDALQWAKKKRQKNIVALLLAHQQQQKQNPTTESDEDEADREVTDDSEGRGGEDVSAFSQWNYWRVPLAEAELSDTEIDRSKANT